MNSLLNLLRWKYGLVYGRIELSTFYRYGDVDSVFQFAIRECQSLWAVGVCELQKLREQEIPENALKNTSYSWLAKWPLLPKIKKTLRWALERALCVTEKLIPSKLWSNISKKVTAPQLKRIAKGIFNPEMFSVLKYTWTHLPERKAHRKWI